MTLYQDKYRIESSRLPSVISAVREYIRNNPANWGLDKENPFRPR